GSAADRVACPEAARWLPADAIPRRPAHDCEHVRPIRPVAVCLPDEPPLMDVASLATRGPQPVSKDASLAWPITEDVDLASAQALLPMHTPVQAVGEKRLDRVWI